MTLVPPSFGEKFEAIRKAVEWAAGVSVWYGRGSKGGRAQNNNKPWGELRLRTLKSHGVDTALNEDSGDETNPRQEVMRGDRELVMQLTVYSRSQEPDSSGWKGATQAQLRMRYPFLAKKWLSPAGVAIGSVGVVIDGERIIDNRTEDVAVLEMSFFTSITDRDENARGSWIEHVEMTTNLETMPDALQLDKEIMP